MTGWIKLNFDRIMNQLESNLHVPWILATGCCRVELENVGSATYDWHRLGVEKMGEHPSQADLLIVAGWVNESLKKEIELAYKQLSGQKMVMAVGACAISGSPYSNGHYSNRPILVSDIIPVDVVVPGCPPRPEMLLDALRLLKQKILPGPDQRKVLYEALRQTPRS